MRGAAHVAARQRVGRGGVSGRGAGPPCTSVADGGTERGVLLWCLLHAVALLEARAERVYAVIPHQRPCSLRAAAHGIAGATEMAADLYKIHRTGAFLAQPRHCWARSAADGVVGGD